MSLNFCNISMLAICNAIIKSNVFRSAVGISKGASCRIFSTYNFGAKNLFKPLNTPTTFYLPSIYKYNRCFFFPTLSSR